ncbi:MAG: YciI family protein [Pseudomonadota bacterium]
MPYLITAIDHPDKEAEREQVRQAHRDYLASFGKQLLASGALLDDSGETIIGGASLLDTDDRDEALRFERKDPYAKAGIRATVQVVPWRLRWWCGEFDAGGHNPSKQ